MFQATDQVLIERARKGSKRAWLALIKRYEAGVFNHALRMTRNQSDALDVMQETFLSVFRGLDSFRADSSFKTWLYRIVHHRCIDHLRKQPLVSESVDTDDLICSLDGPEGLLASVRQGGQLTRALNELPPAQREVVELKFYQQFTFDEIGLQCGVSSNTVKTRFYTALQKLGQRLVGDEYE
ncbi:RNA polymerase sigma factor [Gilvimarinus sp. SDUM040013]|uniref:RNA polymerase sigma factor n=1 Tax=Gilvimarinus gilvus TaxID=3058038 RepID=A0ABU4RZ78_9GAMM|nr:RNA polymerase sigma factor [Gilvimarinus sp. SDUM040013]MDO3386652.1 RNA polymerase sigma factor [Gilvimarinus sp. SDUM040013]MDX6849461.1 RNA polymerase sigma factor [Gilvimarinus sp. SDUM040013]